MSDLFEPFDFCPSPELASVLRKRPGPGDQMLSESQPDIHDHLPRVEDADRSKPKIECRKYCRSRPCPASNRWSCSPPCWCCRARHRSWPQPGCVQQVSGIRCEFEHETLSDLEGPALAQINVEPAGGVHLVEGLRRGSAPLLVGHIAALRRVAQASALSPTVPTCASVYPGPALVYSPFGRSLPRAIS